MLSTREKSFEILSRSRELNQGQREDRLGDTLILLLSYHDLRGSKYMEQRPNLSILQSSSVSFPVVASNVTHCLRMILGDPSAQIV